MAMATAALAEEGKDKTREELVEACFKVHLELRILMAQKSGEHVPQRLAFATERFKHKLENKVREDILLLYSQACEKLRNMEKAEDSKLPPQKKRKPDDKDVIDRVRYRSCQIPKSGSEDPQLTVRFDSAIEKHLQPILVQCIFQAKILLEKCENFETLKKWLKFPVVAFPQWEDDFYITWGDEGELAIYVHEVGPDCYSQGKCVAVIMKTEDMTASTSSSS